jgi:hypothetical protein
VHGFGAGAAGTQVELPFVAVRHIPARPAATSASFGAIKRPNLPLRDRPRT